MSLRAQVAKQSPRHITDVRVIFTPGKRFVQLLNTVQFQKETTD